MLNLILLFVQIVTTLVRLARPGGVRSVVAESVLLRHQLLVLNRSRRRAPNLGCSVIDYDRDAGTPGYRPKNGYEPDHWSALFKSSLRP